MKQLGRHLIVELTDCDMSRLNDERHLERAMKEAVRKAGATIVSSNFHRYNPQGVSGIVVIAESHLSIHTWPEYGYAALDLFTCGEAVDPYAAFDYLQQELGSASAEITEVKRGIPSEFDEVIHHKPMPSPALA